MVTTLEEFIEHELEAQRQRINNLAQEVNHDDLRQPQQPK